MARDSSNESLNSRQIPAVRVHQWLPSWNDVEFDPKAMRARPPEFFYLFSLSAQKLRRLTGIYRRSAKVGIPRAADTGIQRQHDQRRSSKIAEFVRYGYPWSELSESQRTEPEFASLRKPGWLPTAIVLNVLVPGEKRGSATLSTADSIKVRDDEDDARRALITLPSGLARESWRPSIHPLEIIDGQHRLWAFDEFSESEFELPVVAFVGLDRSWQAYLFWSINITPKRINMSMAFDLYPLLRAEDWLERFEGHRVYRQTRAQEIVEVLWSHPQSPWRGRVNMLGERGFGPGAVTQAAWIHSLTATFIKSWEGRGVTIGGLFGTPVGHDELVLPWSRAQQASLILFLWDRLKSSVHETRRPWARALRKAAQQPDGDAAFASRYSLLATDQGVRAILAIANDLLWVRSDTLRLEDWFIDLTDDADDPLGLGRVTKALGQLARLLAGRFLTDLSKRLAAFDWRTSSAPGLTRAEGTYKAAFRGSGGYRMLRLELLDFLSKAPGDVGEAARRVRSLSR